MKATPLLLCRNGTLAVKDGATGPFADWQEVKVELPEKDRLIHLRITPAKGSNSVVVQSIELRSKDGKAQAWRFDAAK